MNLFSIFDTISQEDPEIFDRINSRRNAMRGLSHWAGKVTLASAPVFLSQVFTKAYGGTNDSVNDILNYALALEFLEKKLYTAAVDAADRLGATAAQKAGLQLVLTDETNHVKLLQGVLGTNATWQGTAEPNIDLTGNAGRTTGTGPFANALDTLDSALAAVQAFEDTGVRAYKGRAAELVGNKVVLTVALNIHSVEARHASYIRKLRGKKSWITSNKPETPFDSLVQGNYNGEDNVSQGGVNLQNALSGQSVDAITQAFDEPLSKDEVIALVGNPAGGSPPPSFFY